MSDERMREANKLPRSITVLDPLRPAVVVRRRVYDTASTGTGVGVPRAFVAVSQPPARSPIDDEEGGPPSSINVARALGSLRSDELQRVDDLVRADEEASRRGVTAPSSAPASLPKPFAPETPTPVTTTLPTQPAKTLTVGKSIAISELADRVGVPLQDMAASLITRGFYAVDAKTVLSREMARVIAGMYGWRVEDAPPEREEATKSLARSRIATKHKVGRTANAKSKTRARVSSVKPAKARLAR